MSKGYVESVETIIKDEYGNDRVTTTKKVFKHNSEGENFYFVFVNYVSWMFDLKGEIALKVLHFMLKEAQVNTGRVVLSAGKKKEIIERLGVSKMSFYNAVKQLIDAKAISKIYYVNPDGEKTEYKGEYMINPEMIWKGDKDKRKELKVTFEAVYSNQ